jgi:hypothetical protein
MNLQLLSFLCLLGVAGCASQPATVAKPSARQSVTGTAKDTNLELQNLIALVNQIYPKRDYAASYSYYGLWIDFRYFGITTVEEARRIILENRSFAEAEETKWQVLYGKNRSREDGGVPSESDRSYKYNCVGMARHALRKHVGLEAFDDYELRGRPNQPPEPTASSGRGSP